MQAVLVANEVVVNYQGVRELLNDRRSGHVAAPFETHHVAAAQHFGTPFGQLPTAVEDIVAQVQFADDSC